MLTILSYPGDRSSQTEPFKFFAWYLEQGEREFLEEWSKPKVGSTALLDSDPNSYATSAKKLSDNAVLLDHLRIITDEHGNQIETPTENKYDLDQTIKSIADSQAYLTLNYITQEFNMLIKLDFRRALKYLRNRTQEVDQLQDLATRHLDKTRPIILAVLESLQADLESIQLRYRPEIDNIEAKYKLEEVDVFQSFEAMQPALKKVYSLLSSKRVLEATEAEFLDCFTPNGKRRGKASVRWLSSSGKGPNTNFLFRMLDSLMTKGVVLRVPMSTPKAFKIRISNCFLDRDGQPIRDLDQKVSKFKDYSTVPTGASEAEQQFRILVESPNFLTVAD